MNEVSRCPPGTDERIAIVSAALRLPGADSLDEYWDNLLGGRDCIQRRPGSSPDHAQTPRGVPENAHFVPAYGAISDATSFDGERFGFSPLEALLTDPQQRLLLEVVDHALHAAGSSKAERERTGVYVGTGLNSYAAQIITHLAGTAGVDDLAVELGTARDFVAGKIAYRLDLHGPTFTVLAACSTALIAVHQGCQALLSGQADVAVAGAAAVRFPPPSGYWAVPGSISSSDGVCRPFDARATGAVPADGVGAVVLKRLDDALARGDEVLAVIAGSAVNNDGRKPGFAHVSARGQESVIRAALDVARVTPESVGYVEGHGSATVLGDTVEWATLRRVFGRNPNTLHVGAVKGNVGHTREAAGMAGLLKAVLSLRHQTIPPSANFEALHPDLRTPGSALHPVTEAAAWATDRPRRIAGVSAFGLGGTNCHVVLEEAPRLPEPDVDLSARAIVLISSHRTDTLEAETRQVSAAIDDDAIAALARHSQRRAHVLPLRRYIGLAPRDREGHFTEAQLGHHTRRAPRRPADVVFVFPGVGAEYVGMGTGFVDSSDVFKSSLDATIELAAGIGVDLHPVFTPTRHTRRPLAETVDIRRMMGRESPGVEDGASLSLSVRHLALFAVQAAYADALIDAGIRPTAVLGHSIGEWGAATVAGVLSRTDAVRVIARRAELIKAAPHGMTAAVAAAADAVRPLLTPGTVIAADNSPQNCTASGTPDGMTALLDRFDETGLVWRRVGSTAAFHNSQLESAAAALGKSLGDVPLGDPKVTMVSSVTGDWVVPGALHTAYWQAQLTSCVQFRAALNTAAARHSLFVELGPGTTASWVRQTAPPCDAIRTAASSYENVSESAVFDEALAALWLHGHDPIWRAGAHTRRVSVAPPALHRRVFDPRTGIPPTDPVCKRARGGSSTTPGDDQLDEGAADVARRLAELWRALLRVDEVLDDDDFFALGGDSLLGRHLIGAIGEMTGTEVPGQVVFASGVLRDMALSVWNWSRRGGAQ
jgi:phthiocerol/phenolphthiocerol synthesis type-I polyketide synthase E